MKKNELLQAAIERNKKNKIRSGFEVEIAKAMPPDLEINRIYCGVSHTNSHSSSQGQVEIEVETYRDAITVLEYPELHPTPTVRVKMERPEQGFIPTVSFYPDEYVRQSWNLKHDVLAIYPVLFHMIPVAGERGAARVYLEWFTKIRDRLIASVRVNVNAHYCKYQRLNDGEYVACGLPKGYQRWLKSPTDDRPPAITVYWNFEEVPNQDALRIVLSNNAQHIWTNGGYAYA